MSTKNLRRTVPHVIVQHMNQLSCYPTKTEVFIYPYFRLLQLDLSLGFTFQHVKKIEHRFAILDYFIGSAKLAIEFDGWHHVNKPEQVLSDLERTTLLEQTAGIKTLRFKNSEAFENPVQVMKTILDEVLVRSKAKQRNRLPNLLQIQPLEDFYAEGFKKYEDDKLRYHSPLEKRHHSAAEVPYSPYVNGIVTDNSKINQFAEHKNPKPSRKMRKFLRKVGMLPAEPTPKKEKPKKTLKSPKVTSPTVVPNNKLILRNLAEDFGFKQKFLEPYIIDLLHEDFKLIIEVDGRSYSKNKAPNPDRDKFLAGLGFKTYKIDSESVINKAQVIGWFKDITSSAS